MATTASIPEIADPPDVESLELSEDESKFRDYCIRNANQAFMQRQGLWAELDDMTYDQSYVSNAKATNAYIPPKINSEDVRTVTGVTREKSGTLVSALLNYNLKPNVMAFDENDMPATDLGDTMTDSIAKSRKLEVPLYENKRPDIVKELVDQGTVFVEERWVEYSAPEKNIKNPTETNLLKLKWDETSKYVMKQATTELLYGPSVYLGNMRQPYFQLQPFVVTRKELSEEEAKAIYGEWPRWKNVGHKIRQSIQTNMNGQLSHWGSWSMVEVTHNMIEELKFYFPWSNTYMVMLSGVPMLTPGFPLSFLTGQCRIPIACGKLEPIPFFAYGRGFGHKNKFNQALYDEMYKGLILKMRKSYQPPMANNTGQTLSKRIFWPANITNNIDSSKLQEIGTNSGISNSDVQALQMIKEIIGESSVTAQFQGSDSGKDPTARQVVENKQQQLMKLGLAIIGLMNLEVDLAWLRLFTILKYWTEPIDEETEEVRGELKKTPQYRNESMESETEDGDPGQRIVRMTDQELPHPDQIDAEAALMTKRLGVPITITYLNAEQLQNIKYKWFIEVTPQEKETSDLRAALFMDNLTKFMQLFGPQALNVPYAQKRFVILNHEDPDKFLAPPAPPAPPGMPPGAPQPGQDPNQPQGGPPGAPPQGQQAGPPQPDNTLQAQMGAKPLPKPSLNTMVNS